MLLQNLLKGLGQMECKNRKMIFLVLFLWLVIIGYNIVLLGTRHELKATRQEMYLVVEQLQQESEKSKKLGDKFYNLTMKLDAANETISDLKSEEYTLVYLGDYKITYYCDERRPHICGGSGVTASGAPTKVGTTIGVDPSVIPLGTTVYMEGLGFRVAQDTGSKVGGKHIDVLVHTHSEALSQTQLSGGVWILVKNS
jgi:3D (Asp-Asp-Asp) domain-containing protein